MLKNKKEYFEACKQLEQLVFKKISSERDEILISKLTAQIEAYDEKRKKNDSLLTKYPK